MTWEQNDVIMEGVGGWSMTVSPYDRIFVDGLLEVVSIADLLRRKCRWGLEGFVLAFALGLFQNTLSLM
jgi:hypothetical protein